VGSLLAILGMIITFKALVAETHDGDRTGRWAWKPLAYILGSNFAFGIFLCGLPSIKLPGMGMIAGVYALTILASLAAGQFKLRRVLILATILAVGGYLTFVALLKLQFPVWPAFLVN